MLFAIAIYHCDARSDHIFRYLLLRKQDSGGAAFEENLNHTYFPEAVEIMQWIFSSSLLGYGWRYEGDITW